MYTAVVLNEISRALLLDTYRSEFQNLERKGFEFYNSRGVPLTHHVTLNMGKFDIELNRDLKLGDEVTFKVGLWGEDERVAALGVVDCSLLLDGSCVFGSPLPIFSRNTQPHITVAINPSKGGKPFHSNKLQAWDQVSLVKVTGIIAEED